jgi:hypothetical protein
MFEFKKPRLYFITSVILGALFCSCFWQHTDKKCTAKLYLTIANNSNDSLNIHFSKGKVEGTSFVSKFSPEYLVFLQSGIQTDTITYEWNGVDDCVLFCKDDLGINTIKVNNVAPLADI